MTPLGTVMKAKCNDGERDCLFFRCCDFTVSANALSENNDFHYEFRLTLVSGMIFLNGSTPDEDPTAFHKRLWWVSMWFHDSQVNFIGKMGQFSEIEVYVLSENWINQLFSFKLYTLQDLDNTVLLQYNYLKIGNLRVLKNLNTKKNAFEVVQIRFLAIHITYQKVCFHTFTLENLVNIFMAHDFYLIF